MTYSRLQFHRLALSAVSSVGLPTSALRAAKIDSTVRGVKMGLITGSLNPLPDTPPGTDIIDTVIAGCLAVGAEPSARGLCRDRSTCRAKGRGGGNAPVSYFFGFSAAQTAFAFVLRT